MTEETKNNIEEVLLDIAFYEKDLESVKSVDARNEIINKIHMAEDLFKSLLSN